jgi:hypothetical protein
MTEHESYVWTGAERGAIRAIYGFRIGRLAALGRTAGWGWGRGVQISRSND